MIYRVSPARNISKQIEFIKLEWPEKPYGLEHGTVYGEYKRGRETLFVGATPSNCKCYKAPILPIWNRPSHLIVNLRYGEMPDIYPHGEEVFVSKNARKIIESIDSFGHQFYPVKIENKNGERVSQNNYFTLNIRRHVDIAQLDFTLNKRNLGSYPTSQTKKIIATLQNDNQLSKLIGDFPLWMNFFNMREFYINENLLSEFNEKNLTGVDEDTVTPLLK